MNKYILFFNLIAMTNDQKVAIEIGTIIVLVAVLFLMFFNRKK